MLEALVGHRRAASLALMLAALAMPAAARAAEAPKILTAGIDANDKLYATWTLGDGTTFDFIDLATVPTPDPDLPEYFVDDNFAGFGCAPCGAGPNAASYTGHDPVPRDRRYFVKVTADAVGTALTSPIWVIDDTKPLIPGDADRPAAAATNAPVAGKPFDGAPLRPPGVASTGSLRIVTPPATVRGLLRAGVRIRVSCSFACGFTGSVRLGGLRVARTSAGWGTPGTRTVVVKPDSRLRAELRRRPRTRLVVEAAVSPFEGERRSKSRSFSVTR